MAGDNGKHPIALDDVILGGFLLAGIPEQYQHRVRAELFDPSRRRLAEALLTVADRHGGLCPRVAVEDEMARAGAGIQEIHALGSLLGRGCLPDELEDLVDALERRGQAKERPPAEVGREGDDFSFTWPTLQVEARVTRLRDSGEIQGELAITINGRALHWGRAILSSTSARESLVTKLNRVNGKLPWRELLEEVCRETAGRLRATAQTVQLTPSTGMVERRLVDKLLLDGETNVLFGDGGAGKSLVALALAVAVATGKPLPAGLTPRRTGPVLYLDYESIEAEHQERLAGILAGLGVTPPVPIFYRRMAGTVADEAPALRSEVARLGAVLVIVDSLGPACGPEPEGADAAVRTLNALRTLGGPARLVLAHISKLHADHRGAARPFGSVYVMNLPRNVWEIKRAEEEESPSLTVGLFHRKTNRGKLFWPFGLRFTFTEHWTTIHPTDLSEDAGLRERAGLSYSILAALRSGSRTFEELAEATGGTKEGVKKALQRLEKTGRVLQVETPAPGRPSRWGLKA